MEVENHSAVCNEIALFKIDNFKTRREYYSNKAKDCICKNLVSDAKTTYSDENENLDTIYNPFSEEAMNKYEKVGVLFELPLSPSVINLVTCVDSDKVSFNFYQKDVDFLANNFNFIRFFMKIFTPDISEVFTISL